MEYRNNAILGLNGGHGEKGNAPEGGRATCKGSRPIIVMCFVSDLVMVFNTDMKLDS